MGKNRKMAGQKGEGHSRSSGRYTEGDRQKAIGLLVGGKSPGKVAAEIGCTTESIRLWRLKAQREGKIPTHCPSPRGGQAPPRTNERLANRADPSPFPTSRPNPWGMRNPLGGMCP